MEILEKILNDMRPIDWVILTIAIIPYIMLGIEIIKTKGANQNLITWTLWGILDIIQLSTTYEASGEYLFLIILSIGGFITTCLLIKHGEKKWDKKFHSTIISSVAVCLVIWYTYGAYYAIFFATAAQIIAGIPNLKDIYEKPQTSLLPSYLLFFSMNILSFVFAKAWTFEDRLFTGSFIIYGVFTLYPLFRKLKQEREWEEFYGKRK